MFSTLKTRVSISRWGGLSPVLCRLVRWVRAVVWAVSRPTSPVGSPQDEVHSQDSLDHFRTTSYWITNHKINKQGRQLTLGIRNTSTATKTWVPAVALIRHACKYTVHKLHQRYILMYLVFTRMAGESCRRRFGSLLLYLCYVFRALINSLVCWFCTSALGLVLFQICHKPEVGWHFWTQHCKEQMQASQKRSITKLSSIFTLHTPCGFSGGEEDL